MILWPLLPPPEPLVKLWVMGFPSHWALKMTNWRIALAEHLPRPLPHYNLDCLSEQSGALEKETGQCALCFHCISIAFPDEHKW